MIFYYSSIQYRKNVKNIATVSIFYTAAGKSNSKTVFFQKMKEALIIQSLSRLKERLFKINGAQTRNRTKDTRIFSPLLYQLSYLGTLSQALLPLRTCIKLIIWWAIGDLNPGPAGYEPDALTN